MPAPAARQLLSAMPASSGRPHVFVLPDDTAFRSEIDSPFTSNNYYMQRLVTGHCVLS